MKLKSFIFSFFLLVFFSSSLTVHAQKIPATMTSVDKLYGLSFIWDEAKYNFVFFDQVPELDWDSLYKAFIPQVIKAANDYEYYRVLQRFATQLNDGHTYVQMPQYLLDSLDSAPIMLKKFKGNYFVENCSEEISGTMPPGSEIIRINGFPVDDYLNARVLPYISASSEHGREAEGLARIFDGWVNTKILLTFRSPGGEVKNEYFTRNTRNTKWHFPRDQKEKNVDFKWVEKGVAYLKFESFNNEAVYKNFKYYLKRINKAKALIIDLRNTNSGNQQIALKVASHFTTDSFIVIPPYKAIRHISTTRAFDQFRIEDNWYDSFYDRTANEKWHYVDADTVFIPADLVKINCPVIILTGNRTASAAEDFLLMLDSMHGRAVRVGEITFGSTGQPLKVDLPGGGAFFVCTKRDYLTDGRSFIGEGLDPDVRVTPDIKSILNGSDKELLRALQMVKSMGSPEE